MIENMRYLTELFIQTCLFFAVFALLDYATKYLHLSRFWFMSMLRVMFQLPVHPSLSLLGLHVCVKQLI